MTLLLDPEDIRAAATDDLVLAAARAAVEAERQGRVVVPPRFDIPTPRGFFRVMPAVVDAVMGLKVMTQVRSLGNRYLILLYRMDSGELLALLDADEVTRLRTAATTVLAGEMLTSEPPATVGLVGSGFEAAGHLRLLARRWAPEQVLVHSRSAERREAFATQMSEELAIRVRATDRVAAACDAPLTVLATKSPTPVVDGRDFRAGGVVLSIGSTRPDLRELDARTLERAGTLLVDDPEQVRRESGDIIEALACGVLPDERIVSMAAGADDAAALRQGLDRDLLVFKSVGTAVQDLTLAAAVFDGAVRDGRGREIGEVTRLKAFPARVAERLAEGPA